MKTFAQMFSEMAYNRSPNVDDPKNANKDWRAGYAVGRYSDTDTTDAIAEEWHDRGQPDGKEPSFAEWKIGYWAGRFTQIDVKRAGG